MEGPGQEGQDDVDVSKKLTENELKLMTVNL